MSTSVDRALGAPDRDRRAQALMDAVDAIADMAQRVQLNGAERNYAGEKLEYVVFKAAEGLAVCGIELETVIANAHRGYKVGVWRKEGGR